MILVDTSVWIDYFNGRSTALTDCLDQHLEAGVVATGDLIMLEILQGFRHDRDVVLARRMLRALPQFELLGLDQVSRCAANYRALRRKGVTMRRTTDVIIASFCIEHSLPLLFADRDFVPFVRHLGLVDAMTVA